MLYRNFTLLTTLVSTSLVAGCASVPAKGGFADVQGMVGQRMGLTVHWDQGIPEDQEVRERIQSLLQ